MNKEPEALRLAKRLEQGYVAHETVLYPAAAELRRLHAVNVDLLAALNKACLWHSNPQQWLDQAYAAIFKAEGGTNEL